MNLSHFEHLEHFILGLMIFDADGYCRVHRDTIGEIIGLAREEGFRAGERRGEAETLRKLAAAERASHA